MLRASLMRTALALVAGAVLVGPAVTRAQPPAAPQRQPQLVDQRGHAFTFASLRGEPLVVTFVSAHCSDTCPIVDSQFSLAARTIAEQHVPMRLLMITLDPERDSLKNMRELAREFEADPRTWIVAGGDAANVHRVMSAFGVVAQRDRSGYADVHSTFVYLIDKHGVLRKTLLASTTLGTQIVDEAHQDWRMLTQ